MLTQLFIGVVCAGYCLTAKAQEIQKFLPPNTYAKGLNATAGSEIYLADFNQDGKADILTTSVNSSNACSKSNLYLYLNKGNGIFEPAATILTSPSPC